MGIFMGSAMLPSSLVPSFSPETFFSAVGDHGLLPAWTTVMRLLVFLVELEKAKNKSKLRMDVRSSTEQTQNLTQFDFTLASSYTFNFFGLWYSLLERWCNLE